MTHLTLKALFRNALLGLAAVLALPVVAPIAAFAGDAQGELQEIVVRVLPQPTVAGDNYTLGEVAEFDGFDVPAIAELAKVQLGRSPMPGRAAFLNEGFIRSRLTGSSLAERVRIEVPKGAQVLRAGQTVAAQDVEQMVMAQVLKDVQAPKDDVKLEVLSSGQDLHLPTGSLDWDITQMGKNLSPSGDRSYQVSAKLEGREAWRGIVRVRVKVYQTVVQAVKPIRRDQVIAASDVTEVRKVLAAGKDAGFLPSAKMVVGMRANRPIGQDEAFNESMVRPQVAIAEGGRVTLVFASELLTLAAPGVALAGGQVGAFIPVRNLQSDRIVYGIVQNDDTVKVN